MRAVLLSQVDCAGMGSAECVSANESARQLSRTHAAAGLALGLIGAGLSLYARSRRA